MTRKPYFFMYTIMLPQNLFNLVQGEILGEVTDVLENETDPVTFSCEATGEPVPVISWYLNDVMINVSDISKHNVSDRLNGIVITSYLTIVNAQSSDVGTYSCHAENFIGIDRSSGTLTINGNYIHTYIRIFVVISLLLQMLL